MHIFFVFFIKRDHVLWIIQLSFLSSLYLKILSLFQTVLVVVYPQVVISVILWICIFCRGGVTLSLQYCRLFLSGTLIPNMVKSFTNGIAFVLRSLDTSPNSCPSNSFEILNFLFLPVLSSKYFFILGLQSLILKHVPCFVYINNALCQMDTKLYCFTIMLL